MPSALVAEKLADARNVVVYMHLMLDRYGRLMADIVLPDGKSLNQELVRAGLAWWYRRYAPGNRTLARLEDEAREARRGLWADEEPVAPWVWRRRKAAR